MDFLYADLNEIVDPFAYTVEKTDNTIKMDIDNNKRTLSAKVIYTPGQLTINNGRDEVISFNGSSNKIVQIPEYKIVRVPSDNGDIRAQYSLMKWDFLKEQYVPVEGDMIYLEEQLDELNIENGSSQDVDSKKVGSGNSSISSVKYVHNGIDVQVPLMKSPVTPYGQEEPLSIKINGLKSGGTIHGGTQTGVQSLALGGQPYGLSQQCTLCVTYEKENMWYDIISEHPLVLRHITNGSDAYDITENFDGNGYNSTIDLPIGQGITFVISRQNNIVDNLMPQNILQKNTIQTKIIRGNDQSPTAIGNQAFSMGGGTQANNNWSQAFGLGTITSRPGQMVVGMYNELEPDAMFIVGNGWYDALTGETHRSNALSVMRDGTIKIYDNNKETEENEGQIVTVGYLTNYNFDDGEIG